MDEAQRKSIAAGNCGRRSKPGGHLQVNWRGGLWFRAATAVGAAEGAQRHFEAFTRRSSAFEVVKSRVFRMQDMAMQRQPQGGGGISRSNGKKVSQFHNL